MRVENDEVDVKPGDVIVNPPGGTHGLANTGSEPLRMVVLDVAARAR
jgi:mannose-6-phosphate isomerase-like protein (cupin superfamily)